MWTPTTRKQHSRPTDRYRTDVTDEEWCVIEPHLPAANSTGRPRAWPMRENQRHLLCDAVWLSLASTPFLYSRLRLRASTAFFNDTPTSELLATEIFCTDELVLIFAFFALFRFRFCRRFP